MEPRIYKETRASVILKRFRKPLAVRTRYGKVANLLKRQTVCLIESWLSLAAIWSHKGDRILLPTFNSVQKNLVTTATVKIDGSGYTFLQLLTPGLNLGPGAWSPDDSSPDGSKILVLERAV